MMKGNYRYLEQAQNFGNLFTHQSQPPIEIFTVYQNNILDFDVVTVTGLHGVRDPSHVYVDLDASDTKANPSNRN